MKSKTVSAMISTLQDMGRTDMKSNIIVTVIVILVSIGAWRLERWINWKLFYSGKIEHRVEQLEKRIELLERQTK